MHTIVAKKLKPYKKSDHGVGKDTEIEVPNAKKIRETYEKMNIFMVKKSGYGIEYLQRITAFKYLELFEILKEIDK